jgi:hypothetical protein
MEETRRVTDEKSVGIFRSALRSNTLLVTRKTGISNTLRKFRNTLNRTNKTITLMRIINTFFGLI